MRRRTGRNIIFRGGCCALTWHQLLPLPRACPSPTSSVSPRGMAICTHMAPDDSTSVDSWLLAPVHAATGTPLLNWKRRVWPSVSGHESAAPLPGRPRGAIPSRTPPPPRQRAWGVRPAGWQRRECAPGLLAAAGGPGPCCRGALALSTTTEPDRPLGYLIIYVMCAHVRLVFCLRSFRAFLSERMTVTSDQSALVYRFESQ